jgi:hypothetical protein
VDLKRWLMALAVAALVIAPIGASTTAHAAGGKTASAGPTYHDPEGEGEGEGDGESDGEEGEGEGDEDSSESLPGVLKALGDVVEGLGDVVSGVAELIGGD